MPALISQARTASARDCESTLLMSGEPVPSVWPWISISVTCGLRSRTSAISVSRLLLFSLISALLSLKKICWRMRTSYLVSSTCASFGLGTSVTSTLVVSPDLTSTLT